ncbi:NAD-dependent epimerase/dehydratase family protein [Rhodanobacter sp. 115]|uniref:NAD-dependent epimerase/dehydratase family protein n=1 Tax=Rhodanobacter sp. FW021-MT20 TaxID=1162282 RepID=UPI000260FD05|nr:NAD-dependent epimerase/dehydratase family protein [Rhodanobacter sp. 115]EIL87407.1 NAD-dependent epimerase/dehydratase [Rhodanobacter sp. 115]
MVTPSEGRPLRVLVTGLGGFTGRYVADELKHAGHQVVGLGAEPAGAVARVDLLDAQAVHAAVAAARPTAVVHLAAIAYVAHGDVGGIYQTNIVGTHNLLAALASLSTPPDCVVLASSANVYGNAGGRGDLLDEGVAPAPANDYAVSKLAMEYMARTWADRLSIVFARPFNYTGVGQHPRFLIPKLVEHFRSGKRCIALGNLDVWREFMDVRAVAWVYRRLLETSGGGDTFNICTGRVHSLREVLATMASIAGYAIDVEVNPEFVRDNEVHRLGGDPSLLQQRVGTLPDHDLVETLRWMYQG